MTAGGPVSRDPGLLGRFAGAVTSRVVDVVPPEVVLANVDLDAILDQVDVNHLLDRVDIDKVLDRVDLDKVLDRVDLDRLLARVDLDRLLRDLQLADLVQRAGIPELMAQTTGQLAGSTLDSARRQLVGLDALVTRAVDRLMRRRSPRPLRPAAIGEAW